MNKSRKVNRRKRGTRKYKKQRGGFFNFFSSKPKVMPTECDPNQLSQLTSPEELHSKYQSCCPKKMFGFKNTSPYCKQLELNYNASLKSKNDANEYQGFSPEEVYNKKQLPQTYNGGKKTRKYRK
jgi:hypothetical protein